MASSTRAELLAEAQRIAVDVARMSASGTCNADLVQQALIAAGHKPKELGNSAGAIFKALVDGRPRWEFTGSYVRSARKGSHGNLLRVWRLVR